MTRWVLGADAALDLTRLTEFLIEQLPAEADKTVDIVLNALEILARHPQIGRPIKLGLRELVISRGASGYLALYQYDEAQDLALVLRVRHQRESGYPQV
ncbi:MAG: type II toxin-antitoxin system RelE/ParE family toxin [Polaromonas sp.]